MIATIPLQSTLEHRVVKCDVSWLQYDRMIRESDKRRTRIAFDQGVLEIMSPSRLHETAGSFIGRMIETFTEVRDIEIAAVKSTTFRREDVQRGFEADESYYIANAQRVRGLAEIDLSIHPGPDLVLEVDIGRSSLPKFGIYAALRVSEVWLYYGDRLRVFVLQVDGQFDEVPGSRVLPEFPISEIPHWFEKIQELGETKAIRAFRSQETARSSSVE